MRARLAHVDVPVPRAHLSDPARRLAVRERAYRVMSRLGDVQPVGIRYAVDPTDGPLSEHGLPDDDTAVVRMLAYVVARES